AAARGPDQHDELSVGDVEVDALNRRCAVERLDNIAERDLRHFSPFHNPGDHAGDVAFHQRRAADRRRRGGAATLINPPVKRFTTPQVQWAIIPADARTELPRPCRETLLLDHPASRGRDHSLFTRAAGGGCARSIALAALYRNDVKFRHHSMVAAGSAARLR